MVMGLQVNVEYGAELPADGDLDRDDIQKIVESVLAKHQEFGAVTVVLADDGVLRELNRTYRKIDAPTDVLSFNLDDDLVAADPDELPLGDVYISLERARQQAAEAGRPLQAEIEHLAVHGVLHLIGYEHDTDAGFREMIEEEEWFLSSNSVRSGVEANPVPGADSKGA